jgi:hypothetical protein
MAHVTANLDSIFADASDSAPWSKLKDSHVLSQLRSKFWGKRIQEEAEEWRKSHPTVTVDEDNDIGRDCYMLDLGIELERSKLWVRQDYIRIYDYCSKRHEEGPSSATETARSVAITGQPGVGVFLSSIPSRLSREKGNRIGSLTPSVVVSANKGLFFGTEVASATCLSIMEYFDETLRVSPPVILHHSYGLSSTRMDSQLTFS